MGLSSSTSKQESKTNETTNATQTPVAPEYLTNAAQDYVGRIGGFAGMDPYKFVAPASPLQQQAFSNAGNLGGWQGGLMQAQNLAGSVAGRGSNTAGMPAQYQPGQGQASGYTAPTLSNATTVAGQSYNAPQLGTAHTTSAQGYSAPNLGNSQGYGAARVGTPITAQSGGYTAPTTQRVGIDPATNATASNAQSASLLDNLSAYQSPYTQDVVNNSLNDFDYNAGKTRSAQAAQAARNGAFSGSRYGLQEAATEGELARARGSLDAGLRNQGFQTAAGLSQSDAANRQQTNLFNAQNQTGVSQFNAGAANNRSLAQAGYDQQSNLFNAEQEGNAAQFGAAARNNAGLFNAGAQNQASLAQAQMDTGANEFGANAANQFTLSRAGYEADAGRFNADAQNQAGQFNAGARNQFDLANAGYQADAGQFNANAANQADQFNAGAQNQFAQANAGYQADAGQFNAGAQNQFNLANMEAGNQAAQFNAGSQNDFARFNAGQNDNYDARALQAAGMLGDFSNAYADNARGDLALQGQLGGDQRAIEQAYATAPISQLQGIGTLSGLTPYQILVGQQSNGMSNGTSSGTTSQTPSLFNSLLAGAQVAASFSDRRLKRDVERLGTRKNGLGIYRYRYLWDAPDKLPEIGVMADEVARIVPEALGPIMGGFATVNYAMIGD